MTRKRKVGGCMQPWTGPKSVDDAKSWAEIHGDYTAKRAIWLSLCGFHCALLFAKNRKVIDRLACLAVQYLPRMTAADWALLARAYERIDVVLPRCEERYAQARVIDASLPLEAIIGDEDQPGELALAHCGVIIMRDAWKFDAHTIDCIAECVTRGTTPTGLPCFCVLIALTRPPKNSEIKKLLPLARLADGVVDLDIPFDEPGRMKWGNLRLKIQKSVQRAWAAQYDRQQGLHNSSISIAKLEAVADPYDEQSREHVHEYRVRMGSLFAEKRLRLARTIADTYRTRDVVLNNLLVADIFLSAPEILRDALIQEGNGTGFDPRLFAIHPSQRERRLNRRVSVPSNRR